jgi:hypothetical protein
MKQSPAMRRGPLVSFAAGVALVAAATAARADEAPARVAIEWRAGPGAESCAGAEQLRTAAAAQVRINAIVDDAGIADVVVRGSSVRTSDGWRATILVSTWAGRELGRRELTEAGADCAALDAALVVVLAMIADSSMVDNARGSDPRPPDEPHMVPPRPPPPPPQDPRRAGTSRSSPRPGASSVDSRTRPAPPISPRGSSRRRCGRSSSASSSRPSRRLTPAPAEARSGTPAHRCWRAPAGAPPAGSRSSRARARPPAR